MGLQLASGQVGLGLSPMRAELRLAPGAAYTGTLRLVNEGAAVHVRGSLLDFHIDAEQTPQFEADMPEEAAYSCRRWLIVNPMEMDLRDRGETVVRYTLRIPADASPRSYHCAVGFTTVPTPGADAGIGLQTAVRVVGALYVVVGDPKAAGELSSVTTETVPGSTDVRAVVVLANSGKMFYRPQGTLAVLNEKGEQVESHEITPIPILPERNQRMLFPLKHVPDGESYKIRVLVDVGGGEIQEGIATVQGTEKNKPTIQE